MIIKTWFYIWISAGEVIQYFLAINDRGIKGHTDNILSFWIISFLQHIIVNVIQ